MELFVDNFEKCSFPDIDPPRILNLQCFDFYMLEFEQETIVLYSVFGSILTIELERT